MIERKKKRTAKIGIFAVAHATYWGQFEGLYDNIMGYHKDFCDMVEKNGVEVVDFGMIDSSEKAYDAVPKILAEGVDVLFCNMVTYATSSVFAPIIKEVNKPMVLIALQPRAALDYTKASTFMQLENDNICSVPEFTGVAIRLGKKVNDVIIGCLYNDPEAEKAVAEWCDIAKVLHDLKGARMGLMGHTLEAMYDMHADPTAISGAFGLHVPLLEIDDVLECYNEVTEDEIQEKIAVIDAEFDMPDPKSDPVTSKLTDEDKYQAAKSAVALDKFVEKYNLTGLAYYYEGGADSLHRKVATTFIVGNSILNAQGIPMCGEYDIKTCIAMLIMDRLDIGGSFAEFHPFDFAEDFILVGHDGPHHLTIAQGKPILRSLKKYHGNGELINPSEIRSTKGEVACHLTVDGERIYCVNYISGSVIRLPEERVVVHEGNGINPKRQERAHTHFVGVTPDDKYITVTDLGLDTIFIYDKNLDFINKAEVPKGHGARHLIFSDDGKYCFVANELKSTVSILEYKSGELKYIDTVSCLPEGYTGETTASAIRFNENHIYVSNRGLNTISILENQNGKLVYKDTYSCSGNFPRDFDIIGNYIICTNEKSDSVTVLDKHNFNVVHIENNVKSPICVVSMNV